MKVRYPHLSACSALAHTPADQRGHRGCAARDPAGDGAHKHDTVRAATTASQRRRALVRSCAPRSHSALCPRPGCSANTCACARPAALRWPRKPRRCAARGAVFAALWNHPCSRSPTPPSLSLVPLPPARPSTHAPAVRQEPGSRPAGRARQAVCPRFSRFRSQRRGRRCGAAHAHPPG